MKVLDLRCEYHVNPLGIDVAEPRLSWRIEDERRGARQVAYQVKAGSAAGASDLWDSGRVESDQSVHVVWAGKKLQSRARVYWSVKTWCSADDGKAAEATSETSWFEMGAIGTRGLEGEVDSDGYGRRKARHQPGAVCPKDL